MKRALLTVLISFSLLICTPLSLAEMKAFVREYTYLASEVDSEASCRTIALEQVKRQILEELGTYVENVTVVRDMQVDSDEIKTMTAGVVQTTILQEKWDGRTYWLKAQVKADPADVAAAIDKMRHDDQLVRDLEESRLETALAMDEVQQLKDQMARTEGNNKQIQEEYAEAVNQIAAAEWFERGSAYSQAGNYEAAARSYNQAMLFRPQDPKIYMNRSIVYIQTGNYQYAAQDLDKAAALNTRSASAYINRAVIYKKAYEERKAKTTGRATPNRFRQDFRDWRKDDPLQRVIDSRRTQLNAEKRSPGTPTLRSPEPIRPTTPAPDIKRSNAPPRRDARPEINRDKIRKREKRRGKRRSRCLRKRRRRSAPTGKRTSKKNRMKKTGKRSRKE